MNLFMRLVGLLLCGLLCESVKTLGEYHNRNMNYTITMRNCHWMADYEGEMRAMKRGKIEGKVAKQTRNSAVA